MESGESDSSKKNEDSILGKPYTRTVISYLLLVNGKIIDRKLDLKG